MADETVTGRLEKNGKVIAPHLTASIRSGGGISFLFSPNQVRVGDTLRLLVPPDRVIDFDVVHTGVQLGQAGEIVDGRITSDELYPPA